MVKKNYMRTFKLKQETPMIHFQSMDNGAIIRATEFKPKLDKFLVKKIGDDWEGKKDWIMKQTDEDTDKPKALNYKVKIFPDENCSVKKSNTKIIVKSKETVLYVNGYIHVEIMSFVSGLLDYIEENIQEFLIVTNFGTRQSKGFGSFSIVKKGKNPVEILNEKGYEFIYAYISNKKLSQVLDIAEIIYSIMKGGINRNSYIKGYIQRQYLDDIGKNNVGSDKAFIKSKIMPDDKESKNNVNYSEYKYDRELLGVADSFSFRDKTRHGTVLIRSKEIQRFQSLIQIVVSGNYLILIMKDKEEQNRILGQTFEFIGKKNKYKISVPKEFDSKQFLAGYVKYFNNNRDKSLAADIELKMGGM